MKSVFYCLTAIMVIALAFWAYRENYQTQAAISRSEAVQGEIAAARERLRILNAEWAYLNRPDRLRDLVNINFERLGLFPFQPHQFGKIDQVAYPGAGELPISNVVDVMEREAGQ